MPIKVFISYKWESEAHNRWVRALAEDLRREGIETILDVWEVRFGDSFTDYMTAGISQADVVLFVITETSVKAVEAPKGQGGAVKFEMQMANARRLAGEGLRLIGVYREGPHPPAHLRDHRYADFRNDSDYEHSLRELVSDILGKRDIPKITPVEARIWINEMKEAIQREDLWRAWAAAERLCEIGHTSAVPVLLEGLASFAWDGSHRQHDDFRESLTYCLKELGERAVPALVAAADGADKRISSEAVLILGEIGGREAIDGLIGALRSEHDDTRYYAALMLGELRAVKAIPALVVNLSHGKKLVREAAAYALSWIGAPSLSKLIPLLGHENPKMRDAVVLALYEMGEAAIPALTKAQQRGGALASRTAEKALRKMRRA